MRLTKNKIVKVGSVAHLIHQVRNIILSARTAAAKTIDTIQVVTNYQIGRLIVEHEQCGARRAVYGQKMLKTLSQKLSAEFGRGFSEDNLSHMRKFYMVYYSQTPISETLSRKFISQRSGRTEIRPLEISETVSRKSASSLATHFTLGWSHYIFLMNIQDNDERRFYEIEAAGQNWSLRELRRQFDSGLYERLALSRDKKGIRKLAEKGQIVEKPQDLIKNPYVLEFLGLDESSRYSETELENAIIDKLEHFLLELGKGFLFEARQKRFTFDEEHFFVDLVFYNRILRCYVLFDLKIGKLTHQNLGQMQMYVNYFDRHVRQPGENPTVGIILCSKKKDALVEITLPKDANIRASEYQLYLPSKVKLKQKLIGWTKEQNNR